jgi:trk system potassium uptake protein TrkH
MLRRLSPIQNVLLGFLLLSLLGAALLMTPAANNSGEWQPFLDALFMATSAVSTTGLGVVSIGSAYTLFGQIVVLLLLQIGGLGYMTLIAFIIYLFGRNLSMHGGSLMQETIAAPSRGEIRQFVRRVVVFTVLIEGVGAAALTLLWLDAFPLPTAFSMGVFHAVSAFCTAGFSLFADGFTAYRGDFAFNLVINILSVSGAIGFFVLSESYVIAQKIFQGKPHRLSVHSRLALLVLLLTILGGTAVILIADAPTLTTQPGENLLAASFQAITAASTTGFNTVEIGEMSDASLSATGALMFIGSPAGGTGGGIKSTTFGVLLLWVWAFLRNRKDVNVFGRRLPEHTLVQSVGIATTAALWLFTTTVILTFTEEAPFLPVLFESTSALGTVGLSMGVTPSLSSAGKLILTLSMIIGRVGPLAVAISFFGSSQKTAYRYPSEEIFVG